MAVLLAVVSTTVYLLQLRQHDYLILSLTGQLRLIAQTMVSQSVGYVKFAPRDYVTYTRDLGLYHADLQQQVGKFDHIIQSLQNCAIPADLSSLVDRHAQPSTATGQLSADTKVMIYCSWDESAQKELASTFSLWKRFKQELDSALGPNRSEPRLEYAAHYILDQQRWLNDSTGQLSIVFREMMEAKQAKIEWLNKISIVVMLLINITIVFILYRQVFRPIDLTVAGFMRVARGDLAYKVPVAHANEIGVMTQSFNQLTQRLSALFRLTDRIGQATNLDETLRFAFEEFPQFLPLQWVGLLRHSPASNAYILDRYYARQPITITQREEFCFSDPLFEKSLADKTPLYLTSAAADPLPWASIPFLLRLQQNQLHSVVLMPLGGKRMEGAILVFASSDQHAYNKDHLEFLGNIATQIGNSFEKTVGMESLVVSAIEGLAKLAESRDPETGDHLFRMSRYSALIAEALADQDKYRPLITPQYVRDVFQFAPMHDIGKVGVADAILLKPGKLSEDEFNLMQLHPTIGGQVLRRCEGQVNAAGLSVFTVGIDIAEGHHEKFNGSGYPRGLSGDNIPLAARIVAVADVFDALTSKRPYKEAWPVEKALGLMRSESGKHFDPDVLLAMEAVLPKLLVIYEQYKHI